MGVNFIVPIAFYFKLYRKSCIQTCGNAANKMALSLRRVMFPSWIPISSLEIVSCKVKSCSTVLLCRGGDTWKASIGRPFRWCLFHSMKTAQKRNIKGITNFNQPLQKINYAVNNKFKGKYHIYALHDVQSKLTIFISLFS